MAQLIALDYGSKRTGIAVTDDSQIIASGLTTVDTPQLFKFLHEYFSKHQVEAIILGDPKKLDGTATDSTAAVEALKNKLKETFGKPIHMIDERFTSKMAFQAMIDGGLSKKKRQNKALVDEISATIILQSYMG
ncbi:Holliday junction resolvase RuvX [Crocinitomix catalasitica]|uniref:Holliday junction resolvase RuvX n=1 Tax=Crocinitomix catalasitica TaxID=184607 RepID=UPI0004851BB5|nr:Holliday junction resolvase RuvX [Crocinitomix catalasitica]